MRKPILVAAAMMAALTFPADEANAFNAEAFRALAQATVQEVIDGEVSDFAQLYQQIDEMMKLGVAGAREMALANPEATEILNFTADNAAVMKGMDLDAVEEAWHDYGAFEDAGIDADKFDHFGPVISQVDTIIHPATAWIALRTYEADGDSGHLEQIKDELSEVLEHLNHL